MPELATGFQTLPPEYQQVVRRAQDRFNITITPLQTLVGGWSGAMVYLVSVALQESGRVEHLILKLDRKSKTSKSDEVTRHNLVQSLSPSDFTREHIAQIALEPVEHEGAIAVFYTIAGQSLLSYRPISSYRQQSQLKALFTATYRYLLEEWNEKTAFEQGVHPQTLLKKWLGFRLEAGGNIEGFVQSVCGGYPEIPGLLLRGNVLPNPLAYARRQECWGTTRPLDIILGFIHGDLNANNVLAKFADGTSGLEGYYLIDFALFKQGMPLLYDQRYLEMSYLIHTIIQGSLDRGIELIVRLAEADILEPHLAPVETAGTSAVVESARHAFEFWVTENHPSLHDDLWGQYWLAGVAAGLSYCHKAAQPEGQRLAGLIYAAANLKRFAKLFSLSPPSEVAGLNDQGLFIHTGPGPSVSPPSSGVASHNLPAQTTTFIGRQEEIARAREMLLREDIRIVTLTGPGGTGKTRLSLEIAAQLHDHFKDGVFFVPLADSSDQNQVVSRIAQELEVREAGSQPLLDNLKAFLRDKDILLVLDNFEQLVSTALVVANLISASPSLKALVTSRIRLNLRGENELAIDPLDIPDLTTILPLEQLQENESIKLFADRARAASPSFHLTRENSSDVAQICQRLDGLPLAIELAAARIKLLAPQAILIRLNDRLKLLTGGAQDLPARQRTLRSTLDWSYSLLNAQEKILYARLAVFVGGFTLEDAEAVCNLEDNMDILEGIASLVNNSLLKQEETTGGDSRFRMLETIREYALQRLAESNEQTELQRRHAHQYMGMVANQASFGIMSRESTLWLNRLEREHDNIQAALEWCLATPAGRELALSVLDILTWFWYRRGFFNEGRTWTDRLLAASAGEPKPIRAAALQMSSRMAMWRGDLVSAVTRAKESLTLWQRLEDEQKVPMSLMETGVVLINIGNDREAHTLLKEAEALFKETSVSYFHAITLVHLGNVALGLGNPAEARDWLEKAHPLFREIGEPWGLSFVLNNLGEVARVQGHYQEAYGYYKESAALLQATGDKGDLARLIHTLGYIASHEGEDARAEERFRESLAMFRRLGNKRGIAECIAGLASLRAKEGKPQIAAQMLGAAEALLRASGAAWWPADRVEVEKTRAVFQSELSKDEFMAAWTAGQEMTLEQALTLVSDA
jgi:predicted ATPase